MKMSRKTQVFNFLLKLCIRRGKLIQKENVFNSLISQIFTMKSKNKPCYVDVILSIITSKQRTLI
jgi:hypothetical protein